MKLYGDKSTNTYSIDMIGNLPCPGADVKHIFDSSTWVSSFYDETKEFFYNYEIKNFERSIETWDKKKLLNFEILGSCKIDWLGKELLDIFLQKAKAEGEGALQKTRNPVSQCTNLVFQIIRPRIGKSIAFLPFTETKHELVLRALCIFVGLVAQMNYNMSLAGTQSLYHLNININNIIWDEKKYLFRLYDFALSGPSFNYMKYYIYYNYIEKTMNGPNILIPGENYDIWLFRSPELNELYNVYLYIAQLIKQENPENVYAMFFQSKLEEYINGFQTTFREKMTYIYASHFKQHINDKVSQMNIFPNIKNIKEFIDHIKNAVYHYRAGSNSIDTIINQLKFDKYIDMAKQDSWGVASSLSYLIRNNQNLYGSPIGQQLLFIMSEHVLNHPDPTNRKNLNELYDIIKEDAIIKKLIALPDRGKDMYENLSKLVLRPKN